jgi:hypothetical protein
VYKRQILAYHFSTCGVGVDIRSCVFYGNQHVNATSAGEMGSVIGVLNSAGSYAATRYVSIYNNTFYKNRTDLGPACVVALNLYSQPLTEHIYVMNNIMYDNLASGTSLQILPASYDHGSNYYSNPKFTGSLLTTPLVPFTAVGNYGSVGGDDLNVARGTDGKWGTNDDGLNLDMSSSCINTGIYTAVPVDHADNSAGVHPLVCVRDAGYRLRNGTTIDNATLTSTSYKQDKGAYEFYLKVMCVGSDNSAGGKDDYNYQSYLKQYADAAGFPIDYVGPLATPDGITNSDAGAVALLGGDPSVSQSEKQTKDTQGACKIGAKLSDLLVPAFINPILSTKSDITLVMVGDADNGGITAASAISFAASLVNNNKVILSNIVLDIAAANTQFIDDFNKASFGSVIKGGDPNTISLDGESYISDYTMGNPTADNAVSSEGFKILADNWWTTLGPQLPPAAVAPVATTNIPNVHSLKDTDLSGSEQLAITGSASAGCTYQWIVDGVINTNSTNSLSIALTVSSNPHSIQYIVTDTNSGLRSIYNISVTVTI